MSSLWEEKNNNQQQENNKEVIKDCEQKQVNYSYSLSWSVKVKTG